jgi:hypothetical protein
MDVDPYHDWLNFNIPENLSSVKVQPICEAYSASHLKQVSISAKVAKITKDAMRVASNGGRELIVFDLDEDTQKQLINLGYHITVYSKRSVFYISW